MKYVTTIDFGQLTTEDDLQRIISEAKAFETVENEPISGSVQNQLQTARLVILKVKDPKEHSHASCHRIYKISI